MLVTLAYRLPGWPVGKHAGAYLASPQMQGSVFSMVLLKMEPGCHSHLPLPGVERFILVIEGSLAGSHGDGSHRSEFSLAPGRDEYAFFPARTIHDFMAGDAGAVVLMYEQFYRPHGWIHEASHQSPRGHLGPSADFQTQKVIVGNVDDQRVIDPGSPEVFSLRKLLPTSEQYDMNIHVMDFEPGQYLHCNELHFNQHGLLMLQGQGIYRLGQDKWYHVRAGDAIYMGPYVPQWYAALEPGRTRYVLYKDTNRDPLQSVVVGAAAPEYPAPAPYNKPRF